jgi:hypothetical protein
MAHVNSEIDVLSRMERKRNSLYSANIVVLASIRVVRSGMMVHILSLDMLGAWSE